MTFHRKSIQGAGLGLRREFFRSPQALECSRVDFWEVAPENFIGADTAKRKRFREFTERFPVICHGLSLSIGGPEPLDDTFLARIKRFLDEHQIPLYSEHISFGYDGGQLYDLLPIPFTEAAARHVVDRIGQVQDALGRRIALENISYYTPVGAEMREVDFLNRILRDADCQLLLDVNNVYVNSVNHRFDPLAYLADLDIERTAYIHLAGHDDEDPELLVDTHGDAVKADVWTLLDAVYRRIGPVPSLIERDQNLPPLADLLDEVDLIRQHQRPYLPVAEAVRRPA